MSKADHPSSKAIIREITDPSLEFDLFEMARQRLVQVFITGRHEWLEAEQIALLCSGRFAAHSETFKRADKNRVLL